MRRIVLTAVALFMLVSLPASAIQLSGELAYMHSVESQYYAGELGGVGGSITVLDLGIADIILNFRMLGSTNDLGYLAKLYFKGILEEPVQKDVFLFSDASLALTSTWPLTDDMRLKVRAGIGDVAYVGAETDSAPSYNIYRGLRVTGELQRELAPTLQLFASAEYGPHLTNVFGTHASSSATWRGVEFGLQASIPLAAVRGGLRVNHLRESHDSHRFAGVFLSGSFGF